MLTCSNIAAMSLLEEAAIRTHLHDREYECAVG